MLTKDLAQHLGAKHWGDNIEVTSLRSLQKAETQNISAIIYPKDLIKACNSNAGCLLISTATAINDADLFSCTLIVAEDLPKALEKTLTLLHPTKTIISKMEVHSKASVHKKAFVHKSAEVFPFAYIGRTKWNENFPTYIY